MVLGRFQIILGRFSPFLALVSTVCNSFTKKVDYYISRPPVSEKQIGSAEIIQTKIW